MGHPRADQQRGDAVVILGWSLLALMFVGIALGCGLLLGEGWGPAIAFAATTLAATAALLALATLAAWLIQGGPS